MILSDKVEIIGNSKNLKYYKNKGYNISYGKKILISTIDLSNGSTFKVSVSCDNCGNVKDIIWKNYILFTNKLMEKYYCVDCCKIKRMETNNIRYGGNSPACSKIILEKIQDTNLEKYGNICSLHDHDHIISEKVKQTNLEKYGFDSASKSQEIKDKIKDTVREKYGVDSPLQNIEILNKVKQTNLEKYGVDNVSKSSEIIEKIRLVNIENWGVDWYTQTEDMKNKSKNTCLEKYDNENYAKSDIFIKNHILSLSPKFKTDGYELINYLSPDILSHGRYQLFSSDCNHEFYIQSDMYYHRKKANVVICTICNPPGSDKISDQHQSIIDFLKSIGQSNLIINDRSTIKPLELDIYLPDYKFAIEYNGLYWHSEKFKDKNYHFNKFLSCNAKSIDIMQICESDWIKNNDIIKSIIKYKLKKLTNKIYARNCEIKIISDNNLIKSFLKENHIQGWTNSKIKIGLLYKNELVSLMTFGWRRTNSKKEFELIRFCNKKDIVVIGGASKLFTYFINNFEFDEIISYSDNSYSNGSLYSILKFNNNGFTNINYYWWDGLQNLKKYHRFNFNKKKLVKEGFDINSTEVEIMHSRGYLRIWGSGHTKWIYKK